MLLLKHCSIYLQYLTPEKVMSTIIIICQSPWLFFILLREAEISASFASKLISQLLIDEQDPNLYFFIFRAVHTTAKETHESPWKKRQNLNHARTIHDSGAFS